MHRWNIENKIEPLVIHQYFTHSRTLSLMITLAKTIVTSSLLPIQCDTTVGYGGSPDENGQTTLDAMIMDGLGVILL